MRIILSTSALIAGLTTSPVLAQPFPPSAPAAMSGPTTVLVGTRKTYKVCWNGPSGVPYVWKWSARYKKAALVSETTSGTCFSATFQFSSPGADIVQKTASAGGIQWPTPTRNVNIRWPRLSDTAGPYRIRGRVKKNGKIVGPEKTLWKSEANVTRFSGGVVRVAPKNTLVICSSIMDRVTGLYPRENSKLISRCAKV